MPRLVTIDQIAEGMELEQAVKNQYDQLLIPADTRIKEKHKKVLKTWGITSVYIKEYLTNLTDSRLSESQKSEELKLLYQRFGWRPRNFNEEDLFEMILSKVLASGKNSGSKNS